MGGGGRGRGSLQYRRVSLLASDCQQEPSLVASFSFETAVRGPPCWRDSLTFLLLRPCDVGRHVSSCEVARSPRSMMFHHCVGRCGSSRVVTFLATDGLSASPGFASGGRSPGPSRLRAEKGPFLLASCGP